MKASINSLACPRRSWKPRGLSFENCYKCSQTAQWDRLVKQSAGGGRKSRVICKLRSGILSNPIFSTENIRSKYWSSIKAVIKTLLQNKFAKRQISIRYIFSRNHHLEPLGANFGIIFKYYFTSYEHIQFKNTYLDKIFTEYDALYVGTYTLLSNLMFQYSPAISLSWRWRQQILTKPSQLSPKLQGVSFKKSVILKVFRL